MDRFIKAQMGVYPEARNELKRGKKETHWMWSMFPQIDGMGYSEMAKYYAIKDRKEAKAYMANHTLAYRIKDLSEILLTLRTDDPVEIFGEIDARKLQSSMTLFYMTSKDPVFKRVLDKYYHGELDSFTVKKIEEEK